MVAWYSYDNNVQTTAFHIKTDAFGSHLIAFDFAPVMYH